MDNLNSCWDNKKYQFVLLTANILFMTIVFKDFWFDDKLMGRTVGLDRQLPISHYNNAVDCFDLSKYNEKIFLKSYLKHLGFDDNEIKDILHLIDYRDHCAHACGKIYYDERKVAGFLDQYKDAIEGISKVREKEIITDIQTHYVKHISSSEEIKYFVEKLLYDYNLSYNEFYNIKEIFLLDNPLDFQTKAYQILVIYYIDAIIGGYYDLCDYEKKFEADLDALIKLNEEKKEEIVNIIEKDLGATALENFSIIKYESIKIIMSKEGSDLSKDIYNKRNMFDIEAFFKDKTQEEIKVSLDYLQKRFGGII